MRNLYPYAANKSTQTAEWDAWALYVALVTTLYHVYTETIPNLLRHLYS